MKWNSAAFIVPLMLLLVGIEFLIARKQKKNIYHFDKTIANLSIGAAERVFNIYIHGFFYFLFKYIYDHYALMHISNAWYNWAILLLLTDFVWYWYHRLGHEVNLFWAFHIVHHQSEDYNFTTSARITNLQSLVRSAFWSVLPFIGFTPEMVAIILVVHGTYSFFTHTEVVGKLGWLEKVLITPSHHRVHHASNPAYLDKNYGDVFVFWDKMFGTFQEEKEKPSYGLTKPLESYSFLWQHFHYLMEMCYRFRHSKGFVAKCKVLFGRPDGMVGDEREAVEKVFLPHKSHYKPQTTNYKKYIVIQLSLVMGLAFAVILMQHELGMSDKLIGSFLVLLTLINCGALIEQRRWIFVIEYLRLMLFLFLVGMHINNSLYYILILFLSAYIIVNYSALRGAYFRLVFNHKV